MIKYTTQIKNEKNVMTKRAIDDHCIVYHFVRVLPST